MTRKFIAFLNPFCAVTIWTENLTRLLNFKNHSLNYYPQLHDLPDICIAWLKSYKVTFSYINNRDINILMVRLSRAWCF